MIMMMLKKYAMFYLLLYIYFTDSFSQLLRELKWKFKIKKQK